MSRSILRTITPAFFAGFLLLGLACASSGASPELRGGSSPSASLAGMLSGRFEGTSPGNKLTLVIESVGVHSLTHPYDLFLEVSGKYENDNVHQDGYLHLADQGSDVAVGYIPHFDPTVSALSPGAARFTSSEISAACNAYFKPQGDGFAAETLGSASCAYAIRGAVGKWEVRIEPGTLVLRNVETGETLRFRRAAKS